MCGDDSRQGVIKNTSRMTYFFLFIITVIGAWVFRYQETPELCNVADDIFWCACAARAAMLVRERVL